MQLTILLQLLLAHIVTDFVLQPDWLIKKKRKHKAASFHLYAHAFISGLLSLLFTQLWEFWYVAIFIAVTHFLIDWWKLVSKKDNLYYFILDQLAHLLIVLISWLWITDQWEASLNFSKEIISSATILSILIGIIIVVFPAGFVIDKATQKWQKEINKNYDFEKGLDKAGRYIGIFERLLILCFVVMNQMSAIGFLIAAKSILRYADKEQKGARKQTEYVLIGTLISFTIAIVVGLLIRACLNSLFLEN